MNYHTIIDKIKQNPTLKNRVLNFVVHPIKTRPQWWVRLFMFAYIKKGKKSVIYRSVRKDLVPFNPFILGDYSVIEDFSCINNAVGAVHIGHHTRIGLHNTIIGPVTIGNNVNLAQGVTVSALNHNYTDVSRTISSQGVSISPITIEDDVWIAANSVITAGTTIGCHSVIAAGSVVTKSVPPYSLVAGTPARIIKQYDFEKKEWKNISNR